MESIENKLIRSAIGSFGNRYFGLLDLYYLCSLLSENYDVELTRDRINETVFNLSENGSILQEDAPNGMWVFRNVPKKLDEQSKNIR